MNWEGEVVPEGPWLDKTLFSVGDTDITNEHVVLGSSTIVIIIIVIVAVCCGVSWWKRKSIANQARRASTWIRRSINEQVYGNSTQELGEDSGFQSPNKLGRNN